MKDVGDAVLAGSLPPFLERERAAVDVDVGPERRSPRYHEICLDSCSPLDSFLLFFQEAKGFGPPLFQEGWRTCVLLGYGNLVRPLRCGYLHTRWKGRPCARVRFNSCKKRCRRRLTVRMLSCPRSRTRPRSTLSSSRKNTVMQCCRAAMKLRRSKCRSCNLDVCLFARADFD